MEEEAKENLSQLGLKKKCSCTMTMNVTHGCNANPWIQEQEQVQTTHCH